MALMVFVHFLAQPSFHIVFAPQMGKTSLLMVRLPHPLPMRMHLTTTMVIFLRMEITLTGYLRMGVKRASLNIQQN